MTTKAQRRKFNAEHKKRILVETDRAVETGVVGAILRRVAGEGTGQVLPPVGAIARDGARICAGPKRTCCATESTNCASAQEAFTHRILCFFHGAMAAVRSHRFVKERVVPSKEIDHAVKRKKRFEANSTKQTDEEA